MSPADLNIRIVQADTVWHDPQANRDYYTALLAGMAPDADIIVLPETFTSGFSNDALAQAEAMDGPTVVWLREQAMALNAVVTGSVQIRDDAAVFNRMLWAAPDGSTSRPADVPLESWPPAPLKEQPVKEAVGTRAALKPAPPDTTETLVAPATLQALKLVFTTLMAAARDTATPPPRTDIKG